jgi:hypothetical protein
MSDIRQQAHAIINTCKTVLESRKKDLPPVDRNTIEVASAVLDEAKKQRPDDRILAAASIQPVITWPMILSAMETVLASLPVQQGQLKPVVSRYTG